MKAFLLVVLKNLGAMFLTQKVAIWALRLLAKQTENKIDDNVIELVASAYRNDVPAMQSAIEALADLTSYRIKRAKEKSAEEETE